MVLIVRCFKCGQHDVRLIVGGRSIIHARCHSCGANLLEDVMEFEADVHAANDPNTTAEHEAVATPTQEITTLDSEETSVPLLDEEDP